MEISGANEEGAEGKIEIDTGRLVPIYTIGTPACLHTRGVISEGIYRRRLIKNDEPGPADFREDGNLANLHCRFMFFCACVCVYLREGRFTREICNESVIAGYY